MKKNLIAFVLLLSFGLSFPAFANITPYPGLVILHTSTPIGHLSSSQTLSFDLVTAQTADIEMRVVNQTTNEVVAVVTKTWDYDNQCPNIGGGGGTGFIEVTNESTFGQDIVNMTNFPEGIYRIELDLQCPDYWAPHPLTRTQLDNYFNPVTGYGALYIDVGANESDVWSWGGAGLIVYDND